jgi:maltose/moltooligosaccharide transporter
VFLAKLADKIGRKFVYSGSLALGGLSYISFIFFQDLTPVTVNLLITQVEVPAGAVNLMLPMVGVGIAWAAILAMPYAILAGSLPAHKTGVYMGIFNFTIAAPQIVSGLVSGWILSNIFDNDAKYIIIVAGVSMLFAAVSVFLVKETSNNTH